VVAKPRIAHLGIAKVRDMDVGEYSFQSLGCVPRMLKVENGDVKGG
jgi:hypothetical protein